MAICYSLPWPSRGISVFAEFGQAVFANSIRLSFHVAFLAVQVRAILSPGQYEKLKTIRQRATQEAIQKRLRPIIREIQQLRGRTTAWLASASCFVDK